MQSNYIAAIHDVKGWIIVIQVLGDLLSITDHTANGGKRTNMKCLYSYEH